MRVLALLKMVVRHYSRHSFASKTTRSLRCMSIPNMTTKKTPATVECSGDFFKQCHIAALTLLESVKLDLKAGRQLDNSIAAVSLDNAWII